MDMQSGDSGTVFEQNDNDIGGNTQDHQATVEIESMSEESVQEEAIGITESVDSAGEKGEPTGETDEYDPRTSITNTYLECPGIIEKTFAAHKKIFVMGAVGVDIASFSAFFAATLQVENQSPLLIEVGDIFNDYIFSSCIHTAKKSELLKLVFIKSSWLEKCPAVVEGLDAMKTCDGNKFFELLLPKLSYFYLFVRFMLK